MPGSSRLSADLSGKFSAKGPLLFLLRHGRIRGHETRRFIGQTDVGLDNTGMDQARAWQPVFDHIRFDRIYVSGLERARQTAALACPGRTIIRDTRINEINLGEWENLRFDRVRQQFPEPFAQRGRDIFRYRPPRGESFADLLHRANGFFSREAGSGPRNRSGNTLAVTHSGVIRTMVCHWSGRPMDRLMDTRPAYGELFVLACPRDGEEEGKTTGTQV